MEEGTAAVEQDGDHVYEIPRWLLPKSVRDGDVLVASAAAAGDGSVTITVRFDEDATRVAKTPRSKRPRSTRDPGGDIAL